MRYKIGRQILNALTANDKHYLFNRDYLTQPIQVQLSQKQKNFSEFSLAFLKAISNFKHLPKKDDRHSLSIYGNTCCEKYSYINV